MTHWQPEKTDIKFHTLGHTLSELKGIELLNTLSETVVKDVKSLVDRQSKLNTEALDYQMTSSDKVTANEVESLGNTHVEVNVEALDYQKLTGKQKSRLKVVDDTLEPKKKRLRCTHLAKHFSS